jgi:type VI protein secretion system component Hcp
MKKTITLTTKIKKSTPLLSAHSVTNKPILKYPNNRKPMI